MSRYVDYFDLMSGEGYKKERKNQKLKKSHHVNKYRFEGERRARSIFFPVGYAGSV